MLAGAIVVAVVAMVVLMIVSLRGPGRASEVLGPLLAGHRAVARHALERSFPARATLVCTCAAARLRERFAGLALLDDLETLRAEMAALAGPIHLTAPALGLAQLALAYARPAQDAPRLALFELHAAAVVSRRLGRRAREALRDELAMAAALAGEPLAARALLDFRTSHYDRGLVEELARRVVARVQAARLLAANVLPYSGVGAGSPAPSPHMSVVPKK